MKRCWWFKYVVYNIISDVPKRNFKRNEVYIHNKISRKSSRIVPKKQSQDREVKFQSRNKDDLRGVPRGTWIREALESELITVEHEETSMSVLGFM